MNNKKAFAVEEPGYVVEWDAAGPGQFPLKVTSPWFKSYATIDGAVNSSTVTLNEAQTKDATGQDGRSLVFVNIKAGSFQSNQECSIQLVVRRPNQNQSTVSIDAMTGGGEDEGDSAPDSCGDALVSAMSKIVEPDGDVTPQGPDRDNDPNTDSEQETQNDIENTTNAQNTNTEDTATKPNCDAGIDVGWIVCPIIDGSFAIMRVVEGAIVGQLNFTLDNIGDAGTTTKIKHSHSSVLVIANILFAVGILWIVVSQAITGGGGGGFFGAYEAKKILPKLIAGIIVANLSWDLINLTLKLVNALGDRLKAIMLAPFAGANTLQFDFNNGSDLILVGIGGLAAVGMAIFGFFAVSPILIAIVIAILMAIIFSIVRKGMIVVLVTFAPIMLALSPFMPSLFKRYYKLLMNLIIFYIIVMVSVAGCTIIGYIIFQSSGGNKAASIGQSLTKLLGIAVYFGWMIPVLAFAKNNFDVVGKVGGSLQSAGNNLGKQYGQNRLKGNQYRQGRELRKNWRNQRTKEKALEADMNKMTYSGNNPRKKIRAKFMQSQQIGFLPTRGIKNRRAERDRMMGIAENQVVEESIKKATEEASYKGMSSIPYLNKSAVSITDSKGNAVKDKNGNLAKIDTLGDVYKHLAAGRTIKYKDREGNDRVLDGSQKGMQYMAAGALLKNGDATQAIMLDEIADRGETDEVRASARSSLDYMMKDGGAAFASTVPQLMHIPAKTYMTAGSSKLMGYKPETITIGTTEVLKGDDSTARTQMLNSVRELNTNKNLAGERKQGHMDAFEGSMREELQRSGKVEYNGQNYTNIEHLKTALGYDEWEQRDARPDDQSTPPSTPEPSGTPPSTPEPGTYRDDDGNTRQSGGPGSGGVLLG